MAMDDPADDEDEESAPGADAAVALTEELERSTGYFSKEYRMLTVTAIGCVELVKARLMARLLDEEEDEGEE